MNRSAEEMDGLEETEMNGTPTSSPEVPNSNIFCFEPKEYSTKKEKLARSGSKTPGIDCAPPRPPAKSAPPVSRIFSRRETVGPVSVSFRAPQSLASPHYNVKTKKCYFEQIFVDHTKIGQGSFGEAYIMEKVYGKRKERDHVKFFTFEELFGPPLQLAPARKRPRKNKNMNGDTGSNASEKSVSGKSPPKSPPENSPQSPPGKSPPKSPPGKSPPGKSPPKSTPGNSPRSPPSQSPSLH